MPACQNFCWLQGQGETRTGMNQTGVHQSAQDRGMASVQVSGKVGRVCVDPWVWGL